MLEDLSYRRQQVIDVDAAVVGVSRLRWTSVEPETDNEDVRGLMKDRSFDVVPVEDGEKDITRYYQTATWGDFSDIEAHALGYDDVIVQHTPLDTVIERFATTDRYHFFLSHENRITGLVSIVNLNCREARVHIFGLLCELEIQLAHLLGDHLMSDDISVDDVLAEVKDDTEQRYRTDKADGVDRELTEYLHLSEMIKLIRKSGLHETLRYESKTQFANDFNRLVKLRNAVMHPVRTLVNSPERAQKLHRNIEVIERALFHLRDESS
jgi:hypothetical protein